MKSIEWSSESIDRLIQQEATAHRFCSDQEFVLWTDTSAVDFASMVDLLHDLYFASCCAKAAGVTLLLIVLCNIRFCIGEGQVHLQ